jgi:hypothetical protein
MHKFLDDAMNIIVPPVYEMYKSAMININVSGIYSTFYWKIYFTSVAYLL